MGTREPLYILGVNAYDHDVSACLLMDGEIVVAVCKERVTRVKHDMGFYDVPVEYCLETAGIPLERVDLIVRNCYILPVPELERRLLNEHRAEFLSVSERDRAKTSRLFRPDAPNVVTCSHHLAHAYSAFAVSPFTEGAVMVVDGVGSYRADALDVVVGDDESHPAARESESYYRFKDEKLEPLKKVWMGPSPGLFSDEFSVMPGLGALYSRVATYVFGKWDRCGEVMGLAPYGRLPPDPLADIVDGELVVPDWGVEKRHPYMGDGDRDWMNSRHRSAWEDIARRVQEDTERILIARANWLHEQTGATNLCIAGGVGLNCVANGKILEATPFENLFVQPAAGDDGVAIGCAYYGHLALKKQKRSFVMRSAYLGRTYEEEDVVEAIRPLVVRAAATRRRVEDIVESTAALLEGGAIVGWFQGRSEFGPRALGNRSILADPRQATMKDRVNLLVKKRQPFRPFAPVVMAERAHEYFEGEAESPFMLLVKRVRAEVRDKIPAIVHVDGTARVQTVRREENPRLYALLEAFDRRTGVPVLLNTSFNVRGEPIVEAPVDAVSCFLGSRLDALVLHEWILEKRYIHKALFRLFRSAAAYRQYAASDRLVDVIGPPQ